MGEPCPFCGEEHAGGQRCAHCGEWFVDRKARPAGDSKVPRTVCGVLCLGLALLLLTIGIVLYPKLSNVGSEYATAEVIRDVEAYVASHDGQWPTGWSDLSRDRSDVTTVRFELTAEAILADEALIYRAVEPANGVYLTYPHARRDLERLLGAIKAARAKR